MRRALSSMLALAAFALAAPASAQFADSVNGAMVYNMRCSGCHGGDLKGVTGPALSGETFASKWQGRPVTDLMRDIHRMPPNEPNSLAGDEAAQVRDYLLARNQFVAEHGSLAKREAKAGVPAQTAAAPRAPKPVLPQSAPAFLMPTVTGTATGPSSAELLAPAPSEWPSYNRDLRGQRFSPLDQINLSNVGTIAPTCIFQTGDVGAFQASPTLYRGVLYFTTTRNTFAVDATSCKKVWEHRRVAEGAEGLPVNRGVALHEGRVFRGTVDGHLLAFDAATGQLLWDAWVIDPADKTGSINGVPLAIDGRVIVGEAGGDGGLSARVHAFEAATGRHLWSFNVIPQKGEPGYETWGGNVPVGGGASWAAMSLEAKAGPKGDHLVLLSTGNPGEALEGSRRKGANLYTNAVIALDMKTGKLAWHVQQVPHDVWDWDTAAAPVLYEAGGRPMMATAGKDGWLNLYDRRTRKRLARQPTTTLLNTEVKPTREGLHVCPGALGGTEWYGPAFDPQKGQLVVPAVDWCSTLFAVSDPPNPFGGHSSFDPIAKAKGWIRAFDATTGAPRWSYEADSPVVAGVTPTAGGVTFSGTVGGDFLAFDSATGKILYRFNTGGAIGGGISTYAIDGRQYVAVASGNGSRTIWRTTGAATLVIFALPARS